MRLQKRDTQNGPEKPPLPVSKAAAFIGGFSLQKPVVPKYSAPWTETVARKMAAQNLAGETVRERIVQKVSEAALGGAPWAIEFLAEREDGKARQAVDISGELGVVSVSLVSYREVGK